jgi:O-antigen ligase
MIEEELGGDHLNIRSEKIDKWIYCLLVIMGLTGCISDTFCRNIVRVIFILSIVRIGLSWRQVKLYSWEIYKPFAIVMGLFTLILLLSAAAGGHFSQGIMGNTFWYNFCNMFLLFIVGMCIHSKQQILRIVEAIMLSVFVSDLYMYWQIYQGMNRASGFFREDVLIMMGMIFSMILPISLIMILNKKDFTHHHKLYILVFTASFFGLLFNGTRGVWVALLIVLPCILLSYVKNKKRLIAVVLLLCALFSAVFVLVPRVHERVISVGDMQEQSHAERVRIWQGTLDMIKEHPVLGVGLGSFSDQYQHKYILGEAKERNISHAHNNFLQMLGENGIVGLLAFCGMFGYIFYWSWCNRRNVFAAMILAITSIFIIYGFVDYPYAVNGAMRLYWLMLALAIKAVSITEK